MDFCELQKPISKYYQKNCPVFLEMWDATKDYRGDGIYQTFVGKEDCDINGFELYIDILFKADSVELIFARYFEYETKRDERVKKNVLFEDMAAYPSLSRLLHNEGFQEVNKHLGKELHFEDASELIAYLDSFFDKLSKLIV